MARRMTTQAVMKYPKALSCRAEPPAGTEARTVKLWCCVRVSDFRNVLERRRTGQSADHGEGSEGAGQSLATHDGSGVGGREDPRQPKQTSLENRSER